MISVTDVTSYLRAVIPYTYGPNEFTTTSPDDAAIIRFTGGPRPSEWTSKSKPSFQVLVRAKTAQTAEAKANEIHSHLHQKSEFALGDTRVVKCLADQPTPIYLGLDANKRTVYSINFTITTI